MKSCEFCKRALNSVNGQMYCKLSEAYKSKNDLCKDYMKDKRKIWRAHSEKIKR